ncbi:MAG: trehalose-phosphatase [Terracidiphilus sp.]
MPGGRSEMKYFLSKTVLPVVTRLAQERTLCAFDFDGTLSPIAEHPDQAGMRDRTRSLLNSLASLYPCIIVSGRARADVLEKLGDVKVDRVIGNHGAETEATQTFRQRMDQWKAALEVEVGFIPGVWVEDKGLSLAIHYRQASSKMEARKRIAAATQRLESARVYGGKQVVNVVQEGLPNKGDALADERDRLGCGGVMYVGDDENDEDAFAMEGNIVAVRIRRSLHSRAGYFLRSQVEVDELLDLLVQMREAVA